MNVYVPTSQKQLALPAAFMAPAAASRAAQQVADGPEGQEVSAVMRKL